MTDPEAPSFLAELDRFLRERHSAPVEGSYSTRLMADPTFAQRKLMEEAFEVCLELQRTDPDPRATAGEAADLVFHLLAALVGAGISWDEVETVLRDRHGRPARHSTYEPPADGATPRTSTNEEQA